MKHVSVVIPAHNAAGTIAATLASLRTEADLIREVLLVDDASSDGTTSAAQKAASDLDLSLRVLRTTLRNAGGARNVALDEAVAPWIYFLDADDLHLEGGLRALLSAARSDPSTDVVMGSYVKRVNGEDRRLQFPGRYGTDGRANAADYIEGRAGEIVVGSVLVAQQAIGKIRFSSNLSYDEDTLFFARVLAKARPTTIDRKVMIYIVSTERSDDRLTARPAERFLAWRRALRGLADCGIPQSTIKKREGLVALKIARVHYARGDLATAARFLAVARAAPKSPATAWCCVRYRLKIATKRLAGGRPGMQRA